MFTRIQANPKILCGKPVIKGTSIPVCLIVKLVAAGYTIDKVIEAYPTVTKNNAQEALNYAASSVKFIEI